MKCSNPYVCQGQAHPCGQCLPCRINRRRLWCHRILLETLEKSDNAFVTLTYSDGQLPKVSGSDLSTLCPKHLSDWLKRLRSRVKPVSLRYFAVGEYGDVTQRPHYHLALFGLPGCSFGMTRVKRLLTSKSCCASCDVVAETWGLGNVYVGELNEKSAQYISGYVVKKMTAKDDLRLDGRYPEFARMSLKPGIGAGVMDDVASVLLQYDAEDLEDVPGVLRHGKKMMPLGRYLRKRLRARMGREVSTPAAVSKKMEAALQPLREYAFNNSKSLKSVVAEFYRPETERLERVFELFKGRKVL